MQQRLRCRAMAAGATLVDPATVWLAADTRLGRDVTVQPSVFFGPGVSVGDRVEIRSFCHLEGAEVGDDVVLGPFARLRPGARIGRSEEHTSELQSLMRISYAVCCLKKTIQNTDQYIATYKYNTLTKT